ncbi:MAG: patatin-like phospholipase family protein [Chloroflexota bacterium]
MPTKANPLTLAFAGGGAKCAAQAGVLSVLADARLPVGAIAGVSAGGIVAVLHGLGVAPLAIRDYFADTNLIEVWEFDPARRAIFGPEKVRAHIREAVGDKTFANLKIPVTVIAADLRTGREVWLNSGRLDEAVTATMAIPGIFSPVVRDSMMLVDGGIINPLPVDVARGLGPRVVAVDVLRHSPSLDAPTQLFEARGPISYATEVIRRLQLTGILESVYQAATLTANRLIDQSLRANPPDLLIQPEVGRVGLFAFDLAYEAYRAGEAAARAALPQLEELARSRPEAAKPWLAGLSSLWRRVTTKE